MSQEILDIVDVNNQIIGKDLRTRIHMRGYYHRSVHIFIINSNDEIYIQKRNMEVGSYPGYYESSASGHLLSGENYDDAAKRELEEEIGIKDLKLKRLHTFPADKTSGHEFVTLYLGKYDDILKIDKKEMKSGRFMRIDDIKKNLETMKFTPNFKRCFRWFIENGY